MTSADLIAKLDTQLARIGTDLGVKRGAEDANMFATSLHFRIDELIRVNAAAICTGVAPHVASAEAILKLMDMHDQIEQIMGNGDYQ